MLKLNKKFIMVFLLIGSFVLNGCQGLQEKIATPTQPAIDPISSSEINIPKTSISDKNIPPKEEKLGNTLPSGVETKIFNNKTYGYTMILPKSWGTIYDYTGYADHINDEWETIGPYVPYKDPYITSEVFLDTNPARKENQSWLDFYVKERLKGQKYQTNDLEATYPTKIINLLDDKGNYKKTCLLLEHNNLYVFCFDPENRIALEMVLSIRFDKKT